MMTPFTYSRGQPLGGYSGMAGKFGKRVNSYACASISLKRRAKRWLSYDLARLRSLRRCVTASSYSAKRQCLYAQYRCRKPVQVGCPCRKESGSS